ncbi:MAG: hypothetical protein R2909_10190 [Gemmatimonadales bacterium]
MSNEPEYLRRIRERQQRARPSGQQASGGASPSGLSPQEQEALRWAREVAKGAELRSVRHLAKAKYAALFRIQGASGIQFMSVEGFADRDGLVERVKPGGSVGMEVLGAYEVRGGRPISIESDDQGQLQLKMGAPGRANPVSPEKMIRKAAAEAAQREKTRPRGRDRERGGGGGGRGGPGRG